MRKKSKALERSVFALNLVLMVVGGCCSPLLLRLYATEGGNRKWLISWLSSAGWPVLLLPLAFSFASAIIGFIIGLSNFFYAYGISYLPVSTVTLLASTQLVFTASFAFVMVKQKFTVYTINAVLLLSLTAIVLGIHSNGDRPKGEGKGKYYLGFAMMLGVAGTYGLALPLMELSQQRAKVVMSYTVVMEMQLVIGFFATVFSTVGIFRYTSL